MYSGKIAVPPGGGGIVKEYEIREGLRIIWCSDILNFFYFEGLDCIRFIIKNS
jgi:hypothetical protein